jgi:hypothetical protein
MASQAAQNELLASDEFVGISAGMPTTIWVRYQHAPDRHRGPQCEAPREASKAERWRRAGRATVHGFRAVASTLLNEMGFHPDWIERQLAHDERNKVRAAYNHAQYLPERRRMMQQWADYLDDLADGGKWSLVNSGERANFLLLRPIFQLMTPRNRRRAATSLMTRPMRHLESSSRTTLMERSPFATSLFPS